MSWDQCGARNSDELEQFFSKKPSLFNKMVHKDSISIIHVVKLTTTYHVKTHKND
jgi:hypothetical protein